MRGRFAHAYDHATRAAVIALALCCAMLFLGPVGEASAATLPVACGDVSGLIAAIATANNEGTNPGPDVVDLAAGCTYTLTAVHNDTGHGPTGLPVVTTQITIEGHGSTITRDSASPGFRILDVSSGGNLTLHQVTVSGGSGVDFGAGAYAIGFLTADASTFSSNAANLQGGGVYSAGGLSVTDSFFSGNSVPLPQPDPFPRSGGAIYAIQTGSVSGSTFSGNTGRFGATLVFDARPPGGGTFAVSNSTFSGGVGFRGGAIGNVGPMTITGSTFVGNTADRGGAIRNFGPMTIVNSTFANNSAVGDKGGAIANSETLTLIHSTVAGNSSTRGGGAFFSAGEAQFGLNVDLILVNSVVSNNTPKNCFTPGDFTDGGGNVSWPESSCPGSLVDPLLGPLQDNGGPTQTMEPALGSPVIGTAPAASCPATDQRGVTRPQGTGCDIGAVEVIIDDTTPPPAPTLTQTPPDPSGPDVSFSFTDAEAGVSFTCSLDGATPSGCSSPQPYTGLAVGSHTFEVRAVDGSGNVSDPTSFTWTVETDTTPPPAPTLTQTPTDPSGPNVSFSFTDAEAGVTFTCSLDGAAPTACTSPQPYTGLAGGSHTFEVRAVDGSGNTSDPTSFTWTVDATPPPAPTLTQTPTDPSGPDVSFSFTDDEAGVTFTCSLDGAAPTACTSPQPYNGLSAGSHTFEVRAVDAVGNVSGPTSFTWTVQDTTPPPAPTLTQTPTDPSGPNVSFSFTDAEAGVTFTCSLDGAAPTACTSPQPYNGLAAGSHTFAVRAVDGSGNVSDPTSFTWVVTADTPPTVTMLTPTPDQFMVAFGFTVTWSGSDDQGISRYDLYERVGTAGTQVLVQSGTSTSFSKIGVTGTTYCYQVIAVDTIGQTGSTAETCLAIPLDDRSTAVVYSGSITQVSAPKAFQKTLTRLDAAGEQAAFTFTGRKFGVLARVSNNSGMVDILLDGVFLARVDLYAATATDKVYVYEAAVTQGTHTVTIAWTGVKNAASSGTNIYVDGVAFIG